MPSVKTTADVLLSDICNSDNLRDDTLRLIYADWCEENGQPERAEFIRVQIEISSSESADGNKDGACLYEPPCRWHSLRYLEQKLSPGDRWYPPWAKSDYDYYTVTFRRGFIASVNLRLSDWYGEPCLLCNAEYNNTVDTGGNVWQARCDLCSNTGRIRARGPELVQLAPLETVILTDKKPLWQDQRFWWEEDNYDSLERGLPTEIFTHMRPEVKSRTGNQLWANLPNVAPFATEQAAVNAASSSLLKWAHKVNADNSR